MSRLALASLAVVSLLSSVAVAEHVAPPPMHGGQYGFLAPAVDREAVRAALAANRDANLAAFHAYQVAGVFPSNTFKPGELNVWRDRDGHFCAAATIIKASGQGALVAQVAEQNNFIKLGEVKQGPLMDWILTSGFTQAEVAVIQKPFRPVSERPSVERPSVVDAKLRAAETQRLAAIYTAIEQTLVKDREPSLDDAVDQLMHHPALAAQLVARHEVDGARQ